MYHMHYKKYVWSTFEVSTFAGTMKIGTYLGIFTMKLNWNQRNQRDWLPEMVTVVCCEIKRFYG